MASAVAMKFTLVILLVAFGQCVLGLSHKGQSKPPLRRSLQDVIEPLPSQPGGQQKVNTKRQQQKENEDDDNDSSCPVDNVYHCSDPTKEWAIPCDPDSCLWDIRSLVPEEQPELCQFITVNDVNDVLPDEFEPCALWVMIYGTVQSPSPAPSIVASPAPTAIATEAPVQTSAPTMAPVETIESSAPTVSPPETSFPTETATDAEVPPPSASPVIAAPAETKDPYYTPFDTILLNFIIQSPIKTATAAFDKDGLHIELGSLTERHALRHVRNALKDSSGSLVASVDANVSLVSLLAPWSNETVVATHAVSGTVVFHPDNGPPRVEAVNNMVHGAFRNHALQQYLKELSGANDTTLQRVYAVHMGLPSDILPTVATDSATTAKDSKSLRSKTKETLIGWFDWTDSVEWGEWSDTNFIIFVATTGSAFLLLLCLCMFCFCRCRRRRQKTGGENSFTELPDKTSKSTDTEQLSPELSTPKFSNNTALMHDELPPPAKDSPNNAVAVMRKSLMRESMDSIIEAAFDQSSLTQRSVDAVMTRRMNGVVEDDMESSLSNGSNGRSETTSVYSYLDTKSIMSEDEPNYSFGVAVTTNPTIADDEQSANWSIAGGNMTGISDTYGLNPNVQQIYQPQLETPQKGEMIGSSRSNHVVSTTASTPETSNLMIFCDGKYDDSVSLINDSVILSVLDNFNDDFQARSAPATKADTMTTNSRVAAVVASLEARLDGSPESQFSKSWVNYGMAKSPNTSDVSETQDQPATESAELKPDSRSPAGSVSSQRASKEEDRSSASVGSVSLASYAAPAYKKERAMKPSDEMTEETVAFLNNANIGKPPVHRAQSTGIADNRDVSDNGHHQRGRSSSPANYSLRTTGYTAWGSQKFADAVSSESNDMFIQQQQESTAKALAFWNKSSGKSSRASQLVLDEARAPSTSPQSEPSPTDTLTSLRRSPVKELAEDSYQESESDIQSICSYDDRSLFSFAKSKHEREFLRPGGNTQQSLLGEQRLPASSIDGSEEYNLPTSIQ